MEQMLGTSSSDPFRSDSELPTPTGSYDPAPKNASSGSYLADGALFEALQRLANAGCIFALNSYPWLRYSVRRVAFRHYLKYFI